MFQGFRIRYKLERAQQTAVGIEVSSSQEETTMHFLMKQGYLIGNLFVVAVIASCIDSNLSIVFAV